MTTDDFAEPIGEYPDIPPHPDRIYGRLTGDLVDRMIETDRQRITAQQERIRAAMMTWPRFDLPAIPVGPNPIFEPKPTPPAFTREPVLQYPRPHYARREIEFPLMKLSRELLEQHNTLSDRLAREWFGQKAAEAVHRPEDPRAAEILSGIPIPATPHRWPAYTQPVRPGGHIANCLTCQRALDDAAARLWGEFGPGNGPPPQWTFSGPGTFTVSTESGGVVTPDPWTYEGWTRRHTYAALTAIIIVAAIAWLIIGVAR